MYIFIKTALFLEVLKIKLLDNKKSAIKIKKIVRKQIFEALQET